MRRLVALLLALGFMTAMIGQEVAFAQMTQAEEAGPTEVSAVPMSAECAEMMGLQTKAQDSEKPCEGMTPECIAKMGCAPPLALLPPISSNLSREFRAVTPPHMPITPLVGRDTGPEPEPPTRLG